MRPTLLASLCLAVLLATVSSAGVIHVSTAGTPGSFASIAQGIEAASDGDTVLVAPGVYRGEENRNLHFTGRNLKIISSEGPEVTIIDCDRENRAFHFNSHQDSTSLVSGFTIRHGRATSGGGIECALGSTTLRNLVIEDCRATRGGGLAFSGASSRPLVEGVVLYENGASVGGAIYCGMVARPTIRNCTLVRNRSYYGGGIACIVAFPTIERTIIAHSTVGQSVFCDDLALPVTRHCLFFDNAGGDTPCGRQEGNLYEDPLLCDVAGGDLRFAPESPCLPENNVYGLQIGAVQAIGCEPLPSRILRVPEDYSTIAEALYFATPGDTVLVAPGGYAEANVNVPWGVACMSSGGPGVTTVDACGEGSVFLFGFEGYSESDSLVTSLEGFTITGASAPAIKVTDGSPRISDCVITGNTAGGYGAGLRCYSNGNPVVEDVVFADNAAVLTSGRGGAVYCSQGAAPTFNTTVFLRNSSWRGGAVACEGSAPTFTNCTFADNEAESGACVHSSGGSPVVTRCVLAFSRAGNVVSCASGTELEVTSCVVYGNALSDSLCGVHAENIFEDPQFCDMPGGDLRVGPDSPCLPENNPGGFLIGALPQGDCVPGGCRALLVPAEYPTISSAAAAAGFCDTILVSPGVYLESDIRLRSGTTLVGLGGADSTLIDAGGAATAMWIGRLDGTPGRSLPCVVRGITVQNCIGSAVRVSSANVVVEGCVFRANEGLSGGALRADHADVALRECRFEDNRASGTTAYEGGGAVHCDRGRLDVEGCVFRENSADRGGAVHGGPESTIGIARCTFVGSNARWGAVAYLNGSTLETTESIMLWSWTGRVVHCTGGGDANTTRCVLYANMWGTQMCGTQSDIIAEDPGLCDQAGGDFRLCTESVCLPENNPFGVRIGALGAGGCPCPEIHCRTLRVPSEYATIEDALDQATQCDTVLVAPGTYYESDLAVPWGLTVMGGGGPDSTTINAGGAGSIFLMLRTDGRGEPARSRIEGLTLTGATDSAIRMVNRSPEIFECVFTGNSAEHGGAINCEDVSSPIITDSRFESNSAELGGGAVYCALNCSPTLTDVVFEGNEVTTSYYAATGGGGMACYNGCSPTLNRCIFRSNSARKGGGFSCRQGGSPILSDVTFDGNDSVYGGALNYQYNVTGTVSSAAFVGNTARYGGGARLTEGSSPDFRFVTLRGNAAEERGGGVWSAGYTTFDRCTLSDNIGPQGAGFHFAGGAPSVTNSVIAFGEGSPVYRASGSPMVTHSVVYGHSVSDSLQGGHHDNLFVDPMFCDREAGDFTVNTASLCVALNNPWGEAVGAWDVGCGGPVYYVYPDGSGAAPTIQAAVDSCPSGSTIFLGPGDYVGEGNRNIDFLGKSIAVISTAGPEATLIDCEGEGRGFTLDSGEDSLSAIVGVTIRNGSAPNGGGILCEGADPRIENCVIESCSANRGGGVACFGGASPLLEDVSIHWNSATEGGGCFSTSNSDPMFRRCSFYENTAEEKGGAVYSSLGQLALETVTIAGNHSSDHGAGVYLRYCPADLYGVIIAFNEATEGIFSEGPHPPEFLLCDVYGNAGGDSLCGIVGFGNESLDPLFCDFFGGDLTLCENSPCIRGGLPEGHVGRYGAGCEPCSATGVASDAHDDAGHPGLASWASPNPARGEVRVRLSLPERCGSGVVRFYNLSGQLLRRLDVGVTRAGRGEVVWDGRDEAGARLASGVYFYRAEACGLKDRGRLVLLR